MPSVVEDPQVMVHNWWIVKICFKPQLQMDTKNCKHVITQWCIKQHKFLTIVVLIRQILGIPRSKIKKICIFSIYGSSLPFANLTFRLTIWTKYFLLSIIGLLTHVLGAWNMASACEEESKIDEKLNINEVEQEEYLDFIFLFFVGL